MPYIKHPHLPGPGNTDDETQRLDDSARAERLAGQPHALLRVFRGVASDLLFRVDARGTTIGRASGPSSQVDIAVPDARMSREHVRIEFDGEGWSLTDQRSRNGAFVDGVQVIPERPTPIAHGSVIRTGDTLAVFVTDHLDEEDVADPTFYPGVSAAARRIRRRGDVLARATGHVLVTGETGTGKERIARHLASRASAFVWVNCGELSRELARSELFGHVRAAYTGAPGREGLVASAGDGVLFLDEIGELPLDVQPELLRFLEDGGYRPVGSSDSRVSRARVVAATNRNLEEEVGRNSFRRDLLARLRASNPPLSLPALRDRREDIPGWIDRFMREVVDDVPVHACDAGALECLLLYPWRENLRDLRSAVRGALEEPRVWPLATARLPAEVRAHRAALRAGSGDADQAPATNGGAPEPAPAEPPTREQLEAVLAANGGNINATARTLRINRRSLYRLCERLGIDANQFRPGE